MYCSFRDHRRSWFKSCRGFHRISRSRKASVVGAVPGIAATTRPLLTDGVAQTVSGKTVA